MITRPRKLLVRVGKTPENESEKATRRFFGTFVRDIKRNWVDVKSLTTKHISRFTPKSWSGEKLKGKPNANNQLINPV